MTRGEDVVHVRPEDPVRDCLLLMSELKVSHLPVLTESKMIVGIVSLQDIADLTFEGARGGKQRWISDVLPRRGLSANTRLASAAPALVPNQRPLYLKTGASMDGC